MVSDAGKKGYWRVADGSPVLKAEAWAIWADEAYRALMKVAGTYHAVITYKDLAAEIQEASGIRTLTPFRRWIGGVLGMVVREGHRRGDPPLTALVVHVADGMVGTGYAEVLAVAGEAPVEDVVAREQHAAESRLACYRRFGATLPVDGGVPGFAPKLTAAWERQRSRAATVQPPRVCSRCFIQVPATGVCDGCGKRVG